MTYKCYCGQLFEHKHLLDKHQDRLCSYVETNSAPKSWKTRFILWLLNINHITKEEVCALTIITKNGGEFSVIL